MESFPIHMLLNVIDALLYVGEFVVDHFVWTSLTLLMLILLKMTLPTMKWHRRVVQALLWPVGFLVIARCAINPNYLAAYRRA